MIGVIIVLVICIVSVYGVYADLSRRIKKTNEYYQNFIKEKEGKFISFKHSLSHADIPVIKLTFFGKRYGFLLDSGANVNYIDSSLVEAFKKDNENVKVHEGGKTLISTTGVTQTSRCELPFSYGSSKFKEFFNVADIKGSFELIKEESGIELYGILGNEFFQKYRWNLDFERMVVWIK